MTVLDRLQAIGDSISETGVNLEKQIAITPKFIAESAKQTVGKGRFFNPEEGSL